MDHGETDTASKVIALRNAKATNVYLYIYHDSSEKFSLLFSKNDKIYLYQ
jgi:hypothetical protein